MARPEAASAPPSNSTSSQTQTDQRVSNSQLEDDQMYQQQVQPPQSVQYDHAVPVQPVQFPPQNPQIISFGSMQPVQFPPQIPQSNLIHITQPGPNHISSSPSMFQQSQYPMQQMPNNYHFHSIDIQSNPQPAAQFVPVHQVPVQQTHTIYVTNLNTVAWTTGLFDCMDDPLNALVTFCFPCLTFGQIAELVDSGTTSCATSGLIYSAIACLIGCPCFLSCVYRTKLRSRYDLIESPAPDWVTHFLCEYCALCQEYRELKNRGLDPSLGWHENVARNQNTQLYHTRMVPPASQNMMG